MFGIDNGLIPHIARMQGDHTWAVFYMTGNLNSVERALSKWIDRIADNHNVSSIIHGVLFLYLEHRAIMEYKKQERIEDGDYLPVIETPYEASVYGAKRSYWVHYRLEDYRVAEVILEKMFKGQIHPLGVVPIPLPGGNENMDPYRDPFFPVGTRPLFWANCDNNGFGPYVPSKFYGIVDLETGHTFSTVTSKYCLYTNREVYELILEVAGNVFEEDNKDSDTIDEFELSKKSGVCKMIVRRAEEVYQPFINDGWQAILEGINSYDKSEPLRYTFGFQNRKYRIPLLMPEYTVSIQTQHIIPFETLREKVLYKVKNNIKFSAIENSFRDIINSLKLTKLADRDMLPLYCKYFGIAAIPDSEKGQNHLITDLNNVDSLINRSVEKYGKNAYAMLHVIMDYLSTTDRYYYGSDWELGKWVHDFLDASKASDFSISSYIGSKFYDIVSWYDVQ